MPHRSHGGCACGSYLSVVRSFTERTLPPGPLPPLPQVTYSTYLPAVIASPPTNATSGAGFYPNLTSSDLPNCIGAASFGPLGLGLSWALKLAPGLSTAQARFLIANSLDDFARVSNGLFAVPKKPSEMFLYGPKAHQYDPRPADPRSFKTFFKNLYDLQVRALRANGCGFP